MFVYYDDADIKYMHLYYYSHQLTNLQNSLKVLLLSFLMCHFHTHNRLLDYSITGEPLQLAAKDAETLVFNLSGECSSTQQQQQQKLKPCYNSGGFQQKKKKKELRKGGKIKPVLPNHLFCCSP